MAKRISLPVSFPSWASITVGILAAVIGVISIISGCMGFGNIAAAPISVIGVIIDLLGGIGLVAIAVMACLRSYNKDDEAATFWAILAMPVFACITAVDQTIGMLLLEIAENFQTGIGFVLIFYVILFAVAALLGFLALRGKGFKGLILGAAIILVAACIMIMASGNSIPLAIVYYICAIALGIITTVGAFLGK